MPTITTQPNPHQLRPGRPRRPATPLADIDVLAVVDGIARETVDLPPVPVIHREPPPTDTLWTYTEAAAFLRVSRPTVFRLHKLGKLPAVRILGSVRFRRADVEAFVARGGDGA